MSAMSVERSIWALSNPHDKPLSEQFQAIISRAIPTWIKLQVNIVSVILKA